MHSSGQRKKSGALREPSDFSLYPHLCLCAHEFGLKDVLETDGIGLSLDVTIPESLRRAWSACHPWIARTA